MDALSEGFGEEQRAAVALSEVEGIGPARLRPLLDAHGGPAGLLRAARSWTGRSPPVPRGRGPLHRRVLGAREVGRLRRLRPASRSRMEALRESGIRVVAFGGEEYPDRLLHLHDPPVALYVRGPAVLPGSRGVGVVGTRSATPYGRRLARDLGRGLAAEGWTVVSGMAAGVDAEAHAGALDAGGATVGVLGSGLEHRYPAANRRLYGRMEDAGLLASEFPPALPPAPGLFPRRNRIIAALSAGVVVVQAGRRSGALITADHALDLGREVFAVPGPVGPPASAGVHGLLRQGAVPATGAADVLEALEGPSAREGAGEPERAATARVGGDPEASSAVMRELVAGAVDAGELARRTGLETGRVLAALTELELAGRVRALPGDRYEPASTPGG